MHMDPRLQECVVAKDAIHHMSPGNDHDVHVQRRSSSRRGAAVYCALTRCQYSAEYITRVASLTLHEKSLRSCPCLAKNSMSLSSTTGSTMEGLTRQGLPGGHEP